MAASVQKRPPAKRKSEKRYGRPKRTEARKNAARGRKVSAERKYQTARARKPVRRAERDAYEDSSVSLFDVAGRALGWALRRIVRALVRTGKRLCARARAHGWEIAFATLLILTFCDFLTLVFGASGNAFLDGILLEWIWILFRGLLGYGYLLTVPAMFAALLILYYQEESPVRPMACALLLPVLVGILGHLLLPGASLTKGKGFAEFINSLWITGQALTSGGALSGAIAELLRAFFSRFVALLLLSVLTFLCSVVVLDELLVSLDVRQSLRALGARLSDVLYDLRFGRGAEYAEEEPPKPVKLQKPKRPALKKKPEPKREESASGDWEAEDAGEHPPQAETEKARRRPIRKRGGKEEAKPDKAGEDTSKRGAGYYFPPVAKLKSAENQEQNNRDDRAELATTAYRLQETLRSFDVNARLEGEAVRGPSITRYEFKLEQGVKLSKIMNLADDIALSLGANGVRIAPIQNRTSVVGIEVPNSRKTPVLLGDIVRLDAFRKNRSATTFALGKDISGEAVIGTLEELPHVLIAGTTGSGKSVCINAIIISLLYKSPPERLGFIMIDPKMVELAPYNGIPHLLRPVLTDPLKAAGALQWAVEEMMRRYKTFSENGVKKLAEYQSLAEKNKDLQPLRSVVIVIDELADLMMVAAREVEESIMRVAQMGRAAGIHLVIATQRPSADVITGLMKANIPSRIAFAVASAMESRIILDSAGAEKLVGNGDMIYSPLGGERRRVQGCYITPEEIKDVVASVEVKEGEQAPNRNESLEAKINAMSEQNKREKASAAPEPAEEQDSLLPAAVDIVMETGQASTSMLQRRLKLGYSRAARLIDQMESKGYVGPFEGSRPRQLLITKEQWQTIKTSSP